MLKGKGFIYAAVINHYKCSNVFVYASLFFFISHHYQEIIKEKSNEIEFRSHKKVTHKANVQIYRLLHSTHYSNSFPGR